MIQLKYNDILYKYEKFETVVTSAFFRLHIQTFGFELRI